MILLAVAAAAMSATATITPAETPGVEWVEVGYHDLSTRQPERAMRLINDAERRAADRSNDPAVLINLAAANARLGRAGEARRLLVAARAAPDRFDVELADGRWMDSRQAAREAIARLETGHTLAVR